jgi:hypothetical protein
MQFLSNLTKNQLIGISAAIVLIIVLAIVMYRNKQDYEEMKKEAMLEKGQAVVANFDENIKRKHMNGPPIFATIIPERLIDGPLYSDVTDYMKSSTNYGIKHNNGISPVNAVYFDDVDLWFVANKDNQTSLVITRSPDGIIQQYTYSGQATDLPNLDPMKLMGFSEPNAIVLVNQNNPNENIEGDIMRHLHNLGQPMFPQISFGDIEFVNKSVGIPLDKLIITLSQNEMKFRRLIRNARLQMRAMERQGNMLNYDQKMELINNTILEFLLDKRVVDNFDNASIIINQFQFDTLKQNLPKEINCNIIPRDKEQLKVLDTILSTYSIMLNRLFSAIIVNSKKYIEHCNKNPEVSDLYGRISNSLTNLVSNKDLINQACPQCPNVETNPVQKPIDIAPQPSGPVTIKPIEIPTKDLIFQGRVPVAAAMLADSELLFATKDGEFVKLIKFRVDNNGKIINKKVGSFKGNIDDDVMNFNLKDKNITTGDNTTGYNIGFLNPNNTIMTEQEAIDEIIKMLQMRGLVPVPDKNPMPQQNIIELSDKTPEGIVVFHGKK